MTALVPPARIKALATDHRGFPVPWFVAWIDGAPDFRVVGPGKVVQAVRQQLCWICGQRLGAFKTFVIGPMCAVNRVSSEPPSHRDCAEFAAKACPFLIKPRMRRNDKDMPPEARNPGGVMIARNPGVALVWVTRSFKPFRAEGGVLFEVGDPASVEWYAEGRAATRAEVMASIDSGLPLLRAAAEPEGPSAVWELARCIARAMPLVPVEEARP